MPHSKVLLLVLLLLFPAVARSADDDASPAPKTTPELLRHILDEAVELRTNAGKSKPAEAKTTLPWLSSLAEGRRRAAAEGKPLLIRVGASWSGPCRKLDAEIEMPSVQAELARWTLVYLDADRAQEDVAELHVTALPALRVRTMLGEAVAEKVGLLTTEEFVSWLKEQHDAAAAGADQVLLGSGEPKAADVVRLVQQFRERSPAIREAAVRRLAPYPRQARLEVTRTFVEGGLAERLAALELLRQWHAPVEALDPWQPQSLTAERIAALNQWAQKYQPPAAPEVKKLTEQALVEARREIDRMLKADPDDAEAIRHRLAGYGAELLPEVAQRLKETVGDEQRQRLWALRYRLVAADSLALRWPGGLERLAAAEPRPRQQAADELARMATAADQPLLVELFSDNDPLVREISLRGLRNIGGKQTTAALVKLLSDPEPNVRAAVLKQLEEKPDAAIIPKLANYLKTEKDADLLVHAIRFLRAANGPAAARAMIPMLHHESWQVRAEACEALGKIDIEERRAVPAGITPGEVPADSDNGIVGPVVLDESPAPAPVATPAPAPVPEPPSGAEIESQSGQVLPAPAADSPIAPSPFHDESGKNTEKLQAEIYAAMTELLDDADAFVVSRAVDGLGRSDKLAMVEPLARAAARHPDLAPKIVEMLGEGQNMRTAALPHLRAFRKHDSPAVRAAALTGLQNVVPEEMADEVPVGLNDPSDKVRIVAAKICFNQIMEAQRSAAAQKLPQATGGNSFVARLVTSSSSEPPKPVGESNPGGDADAADETPYDIWLEEYYAGRHRPPWLAEVIAPLEKMLQSKSVDERLAAGIALVPLGKAPAVLPKLYELVQANPNKFPDLMPVLPWLVWEQRLAAYRELRKIGASQPAVHSAMLELVNALTQVHDPRAADLLWELLADANVTSPLGARIESGMLSLYGIEGWNYFGDQFASPAFFWRERRGIEDWNNSQGNQFWAVKIMRRELARAAKPRVAKGSDIQRRVALALLTYADRDEAAEAAENLQADATVRIDVRDEAFVLLLALAPRLRAEEIAAATLSGKYTAKARQKAALAYFVHGPEQRHQRPDGIVFQLDREQVVSSRSGVPIVPKPPSGLEVSQLLPLLHDVEWEVSGEAGYLLTLLGESQGLNPLLQYVDSQENTDRSLQRLAYRAIAALDDSSQIPRLKKIYAGLQQQEKMEFYWTIRIMTGPEILKFRKQIRDEVGIGQIRNVVGPDPF